MIVVNNEGKNKKMTHTLPKASRGKVGGQLTRLLAIAAIAGGLTQSIRAASFTWDGGTGATSAWTTNNNSANPNWTNDSVAFGPTAILYFSAANTVYNTVQVNGVGNTNGTAATLVFGPETAGSGGISIIGNNNTITLKNTLGSDLGFTGDLASASIGLWVKAGAGVNGMYANNTSTNTASVTQVGVPLSFGPNTTFVNDSGSDFVLNARLRSNNNGSLILRNGSWLIQYKELNGSGNGTSQMDGGLTIENAKLTLNISGGTTGTNSMSALGQGALNLGLAGSANDATFVFTALDRAADANSNRLTPDSKNLVNVADGTGKRVIQNGSATKKELYSALTINGSATLTLDNNSISGASMEIGADGAGVEVKYDLDTGVRGTGNLYLTGGGTFYTKAGVVVSANGVRNSFTGQTTVHQGTLQFIDSGGFQKSSVIKVDKQGILDVSQASGGAYTVGDSTYLSGSETQTLSGTGHVVGTLLLGTQSILRAGGADASSYRAALSFNSDLGLGPLTVADLSSVYYGAVDTASALSYAGELRVTLAQGFTAGGIYDLFGFASEAGNLAAITIYSGSTLLGSLSQGVGEFASLWTGSVAGQDYSFDQLSGDLSVSAVPEPHTMILLGLAAFLLIANKRRFVRH